MDIFYKYRNIAYLKKGFELFKDNSNLTDNLYSYLTTIIDIVGYLELEKNEILLNINKIDDLLVRSNEIEIVNSRLILNISDKRTDYLKQLQFCNELLDLLKRINCIGFLKFKEQMLVTSEIIEFINLSKYNNIETIKNNILIKLSLFTSKYLITYDNLFNSHEANQFEVNINEITQNKNQVNNSNNGISYKKLISQLLLGTELSNSIYNLIDLKNKSKKNI
jgi:hypothetical protein